MDVQALFVVAFSGQLLSETGQLSVQDAEVLVKTEVQQHVTDTKLLDEIPFLLLDLELLQKLKREHLGGVVGKLISQHYLAPSCKCMPLPEGIPNSRYGNVSLRDLLRVFYLYHTDEQHDGWSCGFRSDFSLAALHRLVSSGAAVLSHEEIGRVCRDFRERAPGLKQSIEYIILRSKLEHVIALLRTDQKDIDEAVDILRKDSPDCLAALLQIQPDYFILKVASALLRETSPPIVDALALLGKAQAKEVKAFSAELVELLVGRLQQDTSHLERITDVMVRIFSLAKAQVDESSDFDLKRFVSWGENLVEHRAEIIALALKSGHVGVRRQVEMLCKTDGHLKILFDELEAMLYALDLRGLKLGDICLRLATYTKPSLQKVLIKLCEADPRLTSLCKVLESSKCSKLRSAIALHNTSEPVNDEILALLKNSKHPMITPALACIDEAEHSKIQACIRSLKVLLYKYQRSHIDQILAELTQIQNVQVKRVLELLQGKQGSEEGEDPKFDKILHEARQALQEVDRQKIDAVLKTLEPACIFARTDADPVLLTKICDELIQVKDLSAAEAVQLLKNAHTQQGALKAVPFIEKSEVMAKEDALALLRSDHTAGAAWSVPQDCVLAAESIRTLRTYLPAEGELATAEHLRRLATMPEFGVPQENVHILGDFLGRGLLFDFADAILDKNTSQAERKILERDKTREQQSALVEEAIKKHFKENYLDKGSVNGAHYFMCNIKSPSEHWIVAALVKIAHKKPILVILDSKNYAIQPMNIPTSVGADSVLAFLFNKFMRTLNT